MGVNDSSTLEEVLKTALKREQAAHKFYENMLIRHSQHSFISDLLEQLKNEEAKHVRLIEKRLAKIYF